MFVAKFIQTTDAPFKSDKNGNFPFIGDVLTGTSNNTLINGTMFVRNGMQPNKLYACETKINAAGYSEVVMIAEVSVSEFVTLRTQLGAGKTTIGVPAATVEVEESRD